MAKFGNRVKQTTATTGTGSVDLIAAPDGFRNFSDEFTNGDDEISYLLVDDPEDPTYYEYGKGTFHTGTPNTFDRDTVEGSSNSGNKVSLVGTTVVVATPTAADFASVFGTGGWGTKSGLVRAITDDASQVAADNGKMIAADASGNSPATLIYTLLAEATAGSGFVVTVKNTGASGTVDIDDDAASLIATLNPDATLTLRCDGTSWHIEAWGEGASGTINFFDNILQRPTIKDYGESLNAIGSIGGGTQDIDLTLGNVVSGTVDTSETTFTFSNPSATGIGCSFTLILTNGGSQTVNWPAAVDWANATAPTLTASGVDVITFVTVDAGTTWFGFAAGTDMS